MNPAFLSEKDPYYTGCNSRLTAYGLMQDFIEADETSTEEDESPAMVLQAIESSSCLFLKEDLMKRYDVAFLYLLSNATFLPVSILIYFSQAGSTSIV